MPITSAWLQSQLDDINNRVSNLLAVAAGKGYGIVSSIVESRDPDQLAVAFNPELNRITVSAGTFVTGAGAAGTANGPISDLSWPLDPLLYVVAYTKPRSVTATSSYGIVVTALTDPESYIAIMDAAALAELGDNACLLAVLLRSDELDEVDTTALVVAGNRHVFSIQDAYHRSLFHQAGDDRNPHGTGLDQVSVGGVSLLRQIHATGFVISPKDSTPGVPGKLVSQVLTNVAQPDPIGRHVRPGDYYLLLDVYPTAVPKIVSATTGAEIEFTWVPQSNILDFGRDNPGTFTITYTHVKDAEIIGSDVGMVTRFRGTDAGTLVSDGALVQSVAGSVDVSAYSGMAMLLDVYVDRAGAYKVTPDIIGTIQPAKSTTPTISFPLALQSASQIAFAVSGSGLDGRVPPPLGRLTVTNKNFVGQYNFMYTISVPKLEAQLVFSVSGYGSYSAPVPFEVGTLLQGTKVIDTRYYNVVDGILYLEKRAYHQRSTYKYVVSAYESKRFFRGYTQQTGTNPTPEGIAATASVKILSSLTIGDAVVLKFDASNPPARKAFAVDFSGGTPTEIAVSLADALNLDPLFNTYAVATTAGAKVVITAVTLGAGGNAYTLTVDGTSTSTKFFATTFAGGSSYKPKIADATGAVLEICQPYQKFPDGALIRVYMTDNLAETDSATSYYHVVDVPLVQGTSVYTVTLTPAIMSDVNVSIIGYDLTKQFQASILLQGTDANGTAVSDQITITENIIHEVDEFGSPLQFVTTSAAYANLNGVVVTESANVGNAKIVALGQVLSRNSSKSRIAEITTSKKGVLAVRDARILHPATLDNNANNQGDAFVFGLAVQQHA